MDTNIKYDENYFLDNGKLKKKVKNYGKLCEKYEVIDYYKNKYPIVFQTHEQGNYLLTNDGIRAVEVNIYCNFVFISSLDIDKIFIRQDTSLTQVWSANVEIKFSVDTDDNKIDYEDGYFLQYGMLFKQEDIDQLCTTKEVIEFYKDKAAIKLTTCLDEDFYLLNDHSKAISNDLRVYDLEAYQLNIQTIYIHDEKAGWMQVWGKEPLISVNLGNTTMQMRF